MPSGEVQGHVDGMLLAVLSGGPLHGYAVAEELRRRNGPIAAYLRACGAQHASAR
jgi:DNA-binding PadR family transcriptional regulator